MGCLIMDIYTVLALLCVTAGCCIFLGFAAGRGFRKEDRLKAQARAWWIGFVDAMDAVEADADPQNAYHYTPGSVKNPYAAELEKINAR
ncbi:hypothetical protein SEA_RASOVI_37 [Microbacterium phage Rasovi]|nr:hypothetical protein SEA_RASOVI_37 [Microbacterium phage Rasovi]